MHTIAMKMVFKLYSNVNGLRASLKGATAIEYALIAALIAGGVAGGIGVLADGINLIFDTINTDVAEVSTTP